MINIRQSHSIFSFNLLVLIALLAPNSGRVFAQNGNAQIPEHARTKKYTSGWECKRGYRKENKACIAIKLPANAYLTGKSYGPGWDCNRGYRQVNENCIAIEVPAHGYLADPTFGTGWKCERGYRTDNQACIDVKVPKNAHH
jgi:hypothetical protein